MRVINVQFKGMVLLPDGNSTKYLNVEERPNYHQDRIDPYDLDIEEVMPGLFMLRVVSKRSGLVDHIPLGEVQKLRFYKEPPSKVGEGKAGPGRGHKGAMKPEVAA